MDCIQEANMDAVAIRLPALHFPLIESVLKNCDSHVIYYSLMFTYYKIDR